MQILAPSKLIIIFTASRSSAKGGGGGGYTHNNYRLTLYHNVCGLNCLYWNDPRDTDTGNTGIYPTMGSLKRHEFQIAGVHLIIHSFSNRGV